MAGIFDGVWEETIRWRWWRTRNPDTRPRTGLVRLRFQLVGVGRCDRNAASNHPLAFLSNEALFTFQACVSRRCLAENRDELTGGGRCLCSEIHLPASASANGRQWLVVDGGQSDGRAGGRTGGRTGGQLGCWFVGRSVGRSVGRRSSSVGRLRVQ